MENLYSQKVISANDVFDDYFLNTKILYLNCFNVLPGVCFIKHIDGEKTFEAFKEQFGELIEHVHQYRWYQSKRKKYQFDKTVIVLKNKCIVELDTAYCEILHDGTQPEFVQAVTNMVAPFKQKQRRQPLEINLIVQGRNRLGLKAMEIKRTKLDIGLFYEDDFKETDENYSEEA